MEFYGKSNETAIPTGHSPSWFDAVNSEFHYDQHRKNDVELKNITNHHMYATTVCGVANPVLNVHKSLLTMATIPAEPIQSNVDYYQQPIPADYINNNSRIPSSTSPSSLYADDNITTYAPCQGPPPWNITNYAQCYGFYDQAPCPLVNIIDMEDFM